jgi:hypothetical protein
VYSAGRSRIRRFLREAGREGRFAGVEAPVESVRALLERIAAPQPKDRPLPRSFAEWRSRVASPPEGALSPGELARRELGDEVTPERLRRVVELVRAGELGPWPPGGDALVRCAERVAEVAEGRIIVSGARRQEQVAQALDEALPDVFDADAAGRVAARLRESAYVLWKRGGEEDARSCLAAARSFEESGPGDNPVARALLEVCLAPVLAKVQEETKADEPDSLLVKP